LSDRSSGPSIVKIAIAGLGFGLDVHLPAFRGLRGVEVIGLLGRDPARAAEVAARSGIPVATDIKSWLKAPVDAVSLALPPAEIERVAAEAIARGLPILSEKPLGTDYKVAASLATRAAERPNAIDFEFAELETFAALHQVIREGVIGRVRNVAVIWLIESRAHRHGQWSWKTDAERHGGALTLLGTHVLYLLEWLFGPISRLSARLDSRATAQFAPTAVARAADDLGHLTLEHQCGAVSSVVVGNANPGVAVHRWTVVGERGSAILENTSQSLTGFVLNVFDRNGNPIRRCVENATDGDSRIAPFRRLAARFIEAVRAGGQCRPNFADGERVAALVAATRRAAETGTWVKAGPPADL
jgi:predicted dehydrogenase